jgi:hypothetical protein
VSELQSLKTSAGFNEEDERYLRLAGVILADQTEQIVRYWRSGISRYSWRCGLSHWASATSSHRFT